MLIEPPSSSRSCAPILLCTRYPIRVHQVPRRANEPASSAASGVALKVVNQSNAEHSDDLRRQLAAEARSQEARHTLVVHAQTTARAVAEIIDEYDGVNVLARDSANFAQELVVTVEKLLGGEIFGLEKYLCWGSNVIEMELRHTDEKYVALDLLQNYAVNLGLGGRAQILATVADEMILNAFFHAPLDAAGHRKNAHLHRSTPVIADPDHPVVVRYGSDGARFGVSVTDLYGSLDPTRVAELLCGPLRERRRSIDLTRANNELGITTIAESVSHLVFNIERGRRTEVIALLDVAGHAARASRTSSINVFTR